VGIDFDKPHFDWGYLFLTNTSCNARVVMQAAHRVRQLVGNRLFVLCHHAFGSYTRPPFLCAVRADLVHTRTIMHRLLRQCITVPENPTKEELDMIKEAAGTGHLREYSEALVSVLAYNELENRQHKRHFVKMINEYLVGAGYEQVEEELMAPDLPEVTLAPVRIKVAFNEISMPSEPEYHNICKAKVRHTASGDDKMRAQKYEFVHNTLLGCNYNARYLAELYEGTTKPNTRFMLASTVAYNRYYAGNLLREMSERAGMVQGIDKPSIAAGLCKVDLFPLLGVTGPGDVETQLQRADLEAKFDRLMSVLKAIQREAVLAPAKTGKTPVHGTSTATPAPGTTPPADSVAAATVPAEGADSGSAAAAPPASSSSDDESTTTTPKAKAKAAKNNWDVLRDNLNKVLYACFGIRLVKVQGGGDRRGRGTARTNAVFNLQPVCEYARVMLQAGLFMLPAARAATVTSDSDDDPLA
jgi:hypothetical protein